MPRIGSRPIPPALLALALVGFIGGAGPADRLLRLAPPDSGGTLVVEDLARRAVEVTGSPLYRGLARLPAVQGWLASESPRKLRKAAGEVEAVLGVPLETLRDKLLGDAVVLCFAPGPPEAPGRSGGLLLLQHRDRALVERVAGALNEAQIRSGELLGVELRVRGGVKYALRRFRPGTRPDEFYVHIDDRTFAWSNSETMIQGVIDRNIGKGPGLGDDPGLALARKALPERSLASLFVDPRLIRKSLADAPRSAKPFDRAVAAMLGRNLEAVEYIGLALEWRDGLVLQEFEALDPARLDPWLRRWLSGPSRPNELIAQVPDTALAIAAVDLDLASARDALWELLPEEERARSETIRQALRGLLLGVDPVDEVLPRLRPGLVTYLESRPEPGTRLGFPAVAAIAWDDRAGGPDLAGPIDNALRTTLALYALTPGRRMAQLRVEVRNVRDSKVTVLTDGMVTREAHRVDGRRLIAGTSPEAVGRFGAIKPASGLLGLRARYFPEAGSFALVDLVQVAQVVRTYRGPIAARLAKGSKRPVAETSRDLDQLLATADLFRAVAFTSSAEAGATGPRRTLSLIAR